MNKIIENENKDFNIINIIESIKYFASDKLGVNMNIDEISNIKNDYINQFIKINKMLNDLEILQNFSKR